MGIYFNPANDNFMESLQGKIYIDKTGLIDYTNSVLRTPQKYICSSRPRRFGKTMAAEMLAAYYSRGCDSKELFQNLEIGRTEGFLKHLNQYDVIFLNMQEFLSRTKTIGEMLKRLRQRLLWELLEAYPNVRYFDKEDVIASMQDIYQVTRIPFVVIIDEWDCVFREYQSSSDAHREYLDFLRDFLKGRSHISLAYMTGILPIKKYGTHSALNMFDEFSMMNPRQLSRFVGFTEDEVAKLCETYQLNMEEMKSWYNGYCFRSEPAVYNPRSVVTAALSGEFGDYWNKTETFEALQAYIDMNYDGLRDDILKMMSGEEVRIDTAGFHNDMITLSNKDDVMTLLIHLGYLGYHTETEKVFIPNHEVLSEYATVVKRADWGKVSEALAASRNMLEAIWNQQEEKVAAFVAAAHFETSHIQYNDENALSYVISLALYSARNFYTVYREFPTGKGYADLVYLPRKKYGDKPALVVELKWDDSAEGAIAQIKERKYTKALEEYKGNLLLVGINYNKRTKEHRCRMEELLKDRNEKKEGE